MHFLFCKISFSRNLAILLNIFQLISLWLFQKPYYQPPNNYVFWNLAMCLVLVFMICVFCLALCILLFIRLQSFLAVCIWGLLFNEYSFLCSFCLKLSSLPSCYCRFIIFAVSRLHLFISSNASKTSLSSANRFTFISV